MNLVAGDAFRFQQHVEQRVRCSHGIALGAVRSHEALVPPPQMHLAPIGNVKQRTACEGAEDGGAIGATCQCDVDAFAVGTAQNVIGQQQCACRHGIGEKLGGGVGDVFAVHESSSSKGW